jgi:hypothetical protein
MHAGILIGRVMLDEELRPGQVYRRTSSATAGIIAVTRQRSTGRHVSLGIGLAPAAPERLVELDVREESRRSPEGRGVPEESGDVSSLQIAGPDPAPDHTPGRRKMNPGARDPVGRASPGMWHRAWASRAKGREAR